MKDFKGLLAKIKEQKELSEAKKSPDETLAYMRGIEKSLRQVEAEVADISKFTSIPKKQTVKAHNLAQQLQHEVRTVILNFKDKNSDYFG